MSSIPENHESLRTNPLVLPNYTKEQLLTLLDEKADEEFPASPKHIAHSMIHADVLRRAKIFIETFSTSNIPVDEKILLSTREAYSLNDFQISVRYEFIKYVNGIDDIVHKGDKRKWANNSLEELHSKHNRWDYLPISMIWCMLSVKKPHYKHYVMWLVNEINSNKTNKILEDVIRYGSLDLFLSLLGVILKDNAKKVNLITNYKKFLEISVLSHNFASFYVLETLNLNETFDTNNPPLYFLKLCCTVNKDTGDELTEYLVSKIDVSLTTSVPFVECLGLLVDRKQYRRVNFLQKTLNKYNIFINEEDIKYLIGSNEEAKQAFQN